MKFQLPHPTVLRSTMRGVGSTPAGSRRPLGARAAVALLLLFTQTLVTDNLAAQASRFLRVGVSNDYPPFSTTGEGFSRAVATELAADLGFAGPLFVDFEWPGLEEDLLAGRFDMAISGITWRVDRSVVGWMSEALAWGGPCVVWAKEVGAPPRVAVNRGGFLEDWVRSTLVVRKPGLEVRTTSNNLELPNLLSAGDVDGFVTDSFELRAFRGRAPADARVECEPPSNAKVIWIAPHRASTLGPLVDEWIDGHRTGLTVHRTEWLGEEPAPLSSASGLARRERWRAVVDLIARRQSFMVTVGQWKRERGLPIEDLEREAVVLGRSRDAAVDLGLDPEASEDFFRGLIEWAKRLQEEQDARGFDLDLVSQVRPELLRLGDRILQALQRAVSSGPPPWRTTLRSGSLPEEYVLLDRLADEQTQVGLFETLNAFRP